jgi:hypothetical protein
MEYIDLTLYKYYIDIEQISLSIFLELKRSMTEVLNSAFLFN